MPACVGLQQMTYSWEILLYVKKANNNAETSFVFFFCFWWDFHFSFLLYFFRRLLVSFHVNLSLETFFVLFFMCIFSWGFV